MAVLVVDLLVQISNCTIKEGLNPEPPPVGTPMSTTSVREQSCVPVNLARLAMRFPHTGLPALYAFKAGYVGYVCMGIDISCQGYCENFELCNARKAGSDGASINF